MVNYVQFTSYPVYYYITGIRPKYFNKMYNKLKEDRMFTYLDFCERPEKLNTEYMDVYKGIESDIVHKTV